MENNLLQPVVRQHIDIDENLIDFIVAKTEAMLNTVKKGPLLAFLTNKEKPVFEWVNDTVLDVLGYDYDEITSMDFLDLIHPDDLELTTYAYDKQKMININDWSFKNRYRKKDGNYVTLIWAFTDLEFGNYMINQAIWLEGINEFEKVWTTQK